MRNRFKHNVIGIIGLLGCLVSSALDALHMAMHGVDKNYPLNYLVDALASLLTPAPSLIRAGSDRAELYYRGVLGGFVLLNILFALLFWLRTTPSPARTARANAALLACQIAIALICSNNLLYLVAAELAFLLPLRSALRWLGVQLLLLFLVTTVTALGSDAVQHDYNFKVIAVELGMTAAWQAIAFAIGLMAAFERRGRIELGAANAELRATHMLLADTVRNSERLRIARDLHDIVGHQLTALNLHLDLALRQSAEAPSGALATSRELARGLLAEVRVVVGSERSAQRINLVDALGALCAGIPVPRIALAVEARLEIASAAVAHALFCCVQEAISNAVRHAGAAEMTVVLSQCGAQIALEIADDGRGSAGAPEGNGLRGMRERLAQLGGALTVADRAPNGFGMRISVPATGGAA